MGSNFPVILLRVVLFLFSFSSRCCCCWIISYQVHPQIKSVASVAAAHPSFLIFRLPGDGIKYVPNVMTGKGKFGGGSDERVVREIKLRMWEIYRRFSIKWGSRMIIGVLNNVEFEEKKEFLVLILRIFLHFCYNRRRQLIARVVGEFLLGFPKRIVLIFLFFHGELFLNYQKGDHS